MSKTVTLFLVIAIAFALTHIFATVTSLYWYYPWFDIVMHLWGGMLIVLGVRALIRLSFPLKANKRTIFGIALLLMIAWEIFERVTGLFVADVYFFDTLKDIFVGLFGVMIGYIFLKQKNS